MDEDEHPRPDDESIQDRSKRARTSSSSNAYMVPLDTILDRLLEASQNAIQIEQQRRETAESQLRELKAEMASKVGGIDDEVKKKYETEIRDLRQSMVLFSP
jgi:predicted  nucleic acid-binding Zn-ribbon protein